MHCGKISIWIKINISGDGIMKRFISLLVAVLLTVSMFATSASAETKSGACGDNLTWEYDSSTSVLTISGSGAMKKYSSSKHSPWYGYGDSIKKVIISDGVTTISDYAFIQHTALENISIGKDVKSIGVGAFVNCTKLKEITFPESLTSISNMAFFNCKSLKRAYFLGAPPSYLGQLVFEKTSSSFAIYYTWWYELLWTNNNTRNSWNGYTIIMESSSVPTPTPVPTATPTPVPTATPTPVPTATPTEEPEYALGDSNGDGKVNSRDVAAIQKHLLQMLKLTGKKLKAADYNRDGNVNSRDIAKLQKYLLMAEEQVGPLPTATPVPTPTLLPL